MGSPIDILECGDIWLNNAECRLSCNFCSHGISKRHRQGSWLRQALHLAENHVKTAGWSRRRILLDFERRISDVALAEAPRLRLSGWDCLEYEAVLDLLSVCRAAKKQIEIVSPGLRLADREFARQLGAYDPAVMVTYLSTDADRYASMTGDPLAKSKVERAMRNMLDLGLRFSVNFVLTRDNLCDLLDVSDYLLNTVGLDDFVLAYFSPEVAHARLEPNIADLFVPFGQLNRELAGFADLVAGSEKFLCLWRVPPCKLDAKLLVCNKLVFSVNDYPDPTYPVYRHPNCEACQWRSKCFFVSRYYAARYPDEAFDSAKVHRVVDRIRA
jgi:hypothetical protein